eukprot:Skav214618  [mRNA]  locus=scaffold961:36811:43741:- [translate_table: standard]
MPPVCNKCRQGISAADDSWCTGCIALESSQASLRSRWWSSTHRSLAEEILLQGARQLKHVKQLDQVAQSISASASARDKSVAKAVAPPPPPPRAPSREELGKEAPRTPPHPCDEEQSEEEEYSDETESPQDKTLCARSKSAPSRPVEAAKLTPVKREPSRSPRGPEEKKRKRKSTRRAGVKHQRKYRLVENPGLRQHRKLSAEEAEVSARSQKTGLRQLKRAGVVGDVSKIAEEWVELKWETGAPLGTVGDALCGLQFYWPDIKASLKPAWRLYRIWRRLEIPCRAPPITAMIVRAFVNWLVDTGELTAAFLIALAFHTYLRTGEFLSLTFGDLQLGQTTGVVTVRAGKSGLRNNIDEAVAIYDTFVLQLGQLVQLLPHHTTHRALVWPKSATCFRHLFDKCVSHFQLQQLQVKPYSLRRGGATHDFVLSGLLEPILLRGRWHSLAVARLYLEDGVAQLPQLTLPHPTLSSLCEASQPFAAMFT